MYVLHKNFKHLKQWNNQTFGNIFTAKISLDQEMERLQQQIITKGRMEDRT
jgi:hypothetical protein